MCRFGPICLCLSLGWLCCFVVARAAAQNFPPAARAAAGVSEAFVNQPIAFSSAGSSDPDSGPAPLTFYWDFSDGVDSVESNPSHAFAAPGAYRVSLTVSDGADSDVAFATRSSAGMQVAYWSRRPPASLPTRAQILGSSSLASVCF